MTAANECVLRLYRHTFLQQFWNVSCPFILYVLYKVGLAVSTEAALRLWGRCFYVWLQSRATAVTGKEAAVGQQHSGKAPRHLSLSSSVAALWPVYPQQVPGHQLCLCLLSLSPRDQSTSSGMEEELSQGLLPLGKPQRVLWACNWILSPPAEAFQAAQHLWKHLIKTKRNNSAESTF